MKIWRNIQTIHKESRGKKLRIKFYCAHLEHSA